MHLRRAVTLDCYYSSNATRHIVMNQYCCVSILLWIILAHYMNQFANKLLLCDFFNSMIFLVLYHPIVFSILHQIPLKSLLGPHPNLDKFILSCQCEQQFESLWGGLTPKLVYCLIGVVGPRTAKSCVWSIGWIPPHRRSAKQLRKTLARGDSRKQGKNSRIWEWYLAWQ